MRKKNVVLTMILLSLFRTELASALDVNFSGSLLDEKCRLSTEDTPLNIILPTTSIVHFKKNRRTKTQYFDLVLKNCSYLTQNKFVSMTFEGADTIIVDGLTFINTNGNTGIVIGIEDKFGNPISLGSSVLAGVITQTGESGENKFTFGTYAQSPNFQSLNEGRYSATVTLKVAYV